MLFRSAYFLLKEQTIEPVEKAKFLTPISQICIGFDKIAINSPPVAGAHVNANATPQMPYFGRRDRRHARGGSADREDWRLHSFVQLKPDSDADDYEKEFADAVAANGLLLNGGFGDSGPGITRILGSSSGDSDKWSGDSNRKNKKKKSDRKSVV